jgi:phosphatidylinositol alpha-1,6-mannosyltransferase
MTRKRILVLTENFPPISGGSGRWFWELYSRLPKEQVLIATNEDSSAAEFDVNSGMNIIRMPLACKEWGLKSITGLKFYIKTVNRLRKLIKQHNIDEIHCGRVIHEGVSAWLLSLLTKVPYICYVHGEDVETAATSGEHNLMVKQVCKRAAYIICNSHNSANIVKKLGYATDEKLHILHPGVDAHRFVPAPANAAFRAQMNWSDKKVILTVGRLQRRKGQDKMIEAMPAILKAHANALYAVIGHGDCLTELQALTKQLKLEEHVMFLTDLSDTQMIECYQQCDLFILPNRTINSDIEGFGMVLVEAQACAKPVIAGDSGGTKETMLIDKSGKVVDCTNADNIANAVNDLLAQPELMQSMGDAGRTHVLNSLDWQAHTESAKRLFEI